MAQHASQAAEAIEWTDRKHRVAARLAKTTPEAHAVVDGHARTVRDSTSELGRSGGL